MLLLSNICPIGRRVRVFVNRFNPRSSYPKDSKMVLDISLLNTQHYKVQIKGKWSNPGKEVESSSTPRCCSYLKGSLWVTLTIVRDFVDVFTGNTHIKKHIYRYVCMYD